MSGFYNNGERKLRPGVYMRIVNSGDTSLLSVIPPYTPIRPSEPDPDVNPDNAIFVTSEGVMYARGPVLSVTVGDDGENILVFEMNTGVETTVNGTTLEIQNQV